MIQETGERIYDNDYADFLFAYIGSGPINFPLDDATILIVAYVAVVYAPIQNMTDDIITRIGYNSIPSLSGLITQNSLDASGITRIRTIPSFNLRGQGVLIGILDTGIDYTNPIFCNADNTTRIAAIWDQTIINTVRQPGILYGTEYSREQINQALQSPTPYDIVPSRDEIGHGTMVAGIAAGNEVPEDNFYGVASEAVFVIVKLKPAKKYLKNFWKIPEDAICYQENDIITALDYLELTANKLGRPMSICIALGTSQNSHDNYSFINLVLTARAENLNFSITVAAGNEGLSQKHYYGTIESPDIPDRVELNVGENLSGFSMELWGDSPGLFSLDIKTPSGEYVPPIQTNTNRHFEITFIFDKTHISIDTRLVEIDTGDQLILLRFTNPTPGIWTFQIYGLGDLSKSFHIWLPITNFVSDNTYFIRSNPDTTLLSFGNASGPITATAYNTEDDSLYLHSGKGFTRAKKIKPDIASPGVNINVPAMNQTFLSASGTSIAAAYTAGAAALLMEWGIVEGNFPQMNTIDIKHLMIRGARRNLSLSYPNQDWGYGILDIYNVL